MAPQLDAERYGFTVDGRPPEPADAQPARRRALIALAFAVTPIAFQVFFGPSGVFRRSARRAPPSLELRAEVREGVVRLSWNPEAVKGASGATVTIHDGEGSRTIRLDAARLQRGTLDCGPAGRAILFRLEVPTPGGAYTETIPAPE